MTADTDPESSQLFTLSDIDISHNELPPQFWATILTFVTYPKSVKEMSTRFLYLILTLARMAANLAAEYKASEDALPPKLELALKEATKLPLQKEVQKGKRKTELLKRPSKKIRLEHQTLEDLQDLEDLSPDEDTQATTPPPTTFVTTPRHDLPLPQSLSPSGKGDGWRTIWEGYISQAPQVNSSTQKPYTWPGQLTHLLEHIWGPGGAGNVLKMAAEVIEDFSLYVIDANTAVSDISSPTREIEIRMKRIWGMSKATGVKQAELILEYKLLAETMFNIEQETFDTRTQLGQLWHARVVNPKLEVTDQARSNFVLQQVQQSMGSENTTDAGKGNQMKRLRREREFANNIALFIRLFGWGIVPLLANAPWKQVLGNVPSTTISVYLSRLNTAVPLLRQICERIDDNFFAFIRDSGAVTRLEKECFQGLAVKKKDHGKHTMAFLFARAGQLEEPYPLEIEQTVQVSDSGKGGGGNTSSKVNTFAGSPAYFDFVE